MSIEIIKLIISGCTLLCTVLGGGFALYKYNQSLRWNRALRLSDMLDKFRTNDKIVSAFHEVEYERFSYSPSERPRKAEIETDQMLEYFSLICYLKEEKLISDKEFAFVEYELRTLVSNREIQKYLFNLYHFAWKKLYSKKDKDNKNEEAETIGERKKAAQDDSIDGVRIPFSYMLHFAKKEGYIKDSFFEKDSKDYAYVIE